MKLVILYLLFFLFKIYRKIKRIIYSVKEKRFGNLGSKRVLRKLVRKCLGRRHKEKSVLACPCVQCAS